MSLSGAFSFKPEIFSDERGSLFESFRQDKFKEACGDISFVQENLTTSKENVFRGFHYQLNPKAQAKLVRVIKGRVLDIILDIRKDSSSFGKFECIELSEENARSLFVPAGFAHGFLALSEECIFHYKLSNYYDPELERSLSIDSVMYDWPIQREKILVSQRDAAAPNLSCIPKDELF